MHLQIVYFDMSAFNDCSSIFISIPLYLSISENHTPEMRVLGMEVIIQVHSFAPLLLHFVSLNIALGENQWVEIENAHV